MPVPGVNHNNKPCANSLMIHRGQWIVFSCCRQAGSGKMGYGHAHHEAGRSLWVTMQDMFLKRCLFYIAAMVLVVPVWSAPALMLEGVNAGQKDNITAWLGNLPEDCNLPAMQEQALLRRARQDARKALEAIGYYQARIDVKLEHVEECWNLHITVTPGEPVHISKMDVRLQGAAEADSAFQALRDDPPVKTGDILRHDQYETLKSRLLRLLSDRGYVNGKLTRHTLRVDEKKQQAAIELYVDSGPRYRFGAVTFQQTALNPALLDKFVRFDAGDYFANQRLLDLRQSLSSSGYYADVRVETGEPDHDKLSIPISITASPRPPHVYTAGIGFATDTGPRLRLGFENRRVNTGGHRYNSELELSPVRSGIGFGYEIPMGNPARERINLTTGYLYERPDEHKSERYRLGVAYVYEMESGWVSTTSLNFEREDYTVADQTDRTDLVMPGYALARTEADNRIYPRRGWHVTGSVRFAEENLASTVSFIQFHGKGKWVFPAFYGRILMRVEAGATVADAVTELPSSVRFFTGGDNTIRGYAYQSLGPVDDDGEVIGGRHLLVGSVEYDIPVYQNWSIALFTDGGNAYDTWDTFDPVYGSGAGVRWHSPIGPIRLDIARPGDGPDNFRLHISMGVDL